MTAADITTLALVSKDDSSDSSESSFAFYEEDLAGKHTRNKKLKQQDQVKSFFDRISTIKSLHDKNTRDWLASLHAEMTEGSIPLFKDSAGTVEDYQLIPTWTFLPVGKTIKGADTTFGHLSIAPNAELQLPPFMMPLGRLFVNARNDNKFDESCPTHRYRATRWTGYEVFLGDDLSLWIVFDDHMDRDGIPWYPVSCSLTRPFNFFDIARLLPSLCKLEHATFKEALTSVKETRWTGKVQLEEVAWKEVDKYFTQSA